MFSFKNILISLFTLTIFCSHTSFSDNTNTTNDNPFSAARVKYARTTFADIESDNNKTDTVIIEHSMIFSDGKRYVTASIEKNGLTRDFITYEITYNKYGIIISAILQMNGTSNNKKLKKLEAVIQKEYDLIK